jgi:hypothetical protein
LVCRSFSINIYLNAANTLFPILLPPSQKKPQQKKKKINYLFVCYLFCFVLCLCILIAKLLYTQLLLGFSLRFGVVRGDGGIDINYLLYISLYIFICNKYFISNTHTPKNKAKLKNPKKKRNKKQIIGECKAVSQWIYIYAQQILYIQSSSPLPHTHKTKQANKQTNKYSLFSLRFGVVRGDGGIDINYLLYISLYSLGNYHAPTYN